jgi:3-oxoacyl-[acyl-carrier-protein] synthase II
LNSTETMTDHIVITGIGVSSPSGNGQKDFWDGLLRGRSNITPAPWPEAADMRCKNVCRVPRNGSIALPKNVPEIIGIAFEACQEALHDSGLASLTGSKRVGLALGTAVGGVESAYVTGMAGRLPALVTSPSQHLADVFGLTGPVSSIPVACAAGAMALIYGVLQLRQNRADVMLAGGFDVISEVPFAGFSSLHLLTSDRVRPFDRRRSGFLIGEGAGFVVMETLESARKRNAHIYGEIRGFGIGADGYHVIHPHPEAAGLIKAMKDALRQARCGVEEVDYVNSHGTATKANDKAESLAMNSVLRPTGRKVTTSSFKAVLGHTMGAAGAIETIGCLLALKHQCIPPTWNFQEIDPECNVDCVPNEPRRAAVKTIVKNSSGFGGTNCSLVLSSC